MSQLIELLWRNKAYEEAIQDPVSGLPDRVGAMFGGFRTEMGFDNSAKKPVKKTRQEYHAYDRVCVYPGLCRDGIFDYAIGPEKGVDPSSMDLPSNLQIPRTVKTDVYGIAGHIDEVSKTGSGTHGESLETFHSVPSTGTGTWAPKEHPYYHDPVGMMIRKRSRNQDDENAVAEEYATVKFVDDLNYANAGDTTISIDLAESIAGVGAVLKKVTVQCSKADHHISEVTLDFSDITRGSGSISSSEHPQANLLTILLDGKEKLHTAYFDCKMGKFGASKFKLGVKQVKYFPPMAHPSGGFDPGSQVAVPGSVTFGCERLYAGESTDTTDPYVGKRTAADTYANPHRGEVNATFPMSGRQMVSDAVNQGYQVAADTLKPEIHTYLKEGGQLKTMRNLEANSTTHANSGNPTTGTELSTQDGPAVSWRLAGCSSYTFKPRESRGTILAINVVLQADPTMF
jgi:hypothetical protein